MENESFYATAAQVMPILYALLFVELRFLGAAQGGPITLWSRRDRQSMPFAIVSIVVSVAFAAAEYGAISVLREPSNVTGTGETFIDTVFGILLAAVVLVPIAGQASMLWNRSPLGKRIHLAEFNEDADDEKA